MLPSELIPDLQEELFLVRNIAQSRIEGETLDFKPENLFHSDSKFFYKAIESGLNPEIPTEEFLNSHSMSYDFLGQAVNLTQCEIHTIPKLLDLADRREQYSEKVQSIKGIIDTSIPLERKSSLRSFENGLESVDNDARMNRVGIKSGINEQFESITGGQRLGQVFVWGGESECGKTTAVKNVFNGIAQNTENVKIGVISLEESEEDFIQSIVCMNLDMSRAELIWTINNKPDFDVKKVYEDYKGWRDASFCYDAYTLDKIEAFIKKNKPHVVLIDHAQFVQNEKRMGLGEWSMYLINTLKVIAKKYMCCINIISQVDKDAAKEKFNGTKVKKKIPRLIDCWGGVGIKAGADAGYMICRDGDNSMIYCDKCRKVWDKTHRYSKFNLYVDGPKNKITGMSLIEESQEETKTPFWYQDD